MDDPIIDRIADELVRRVGRVKAGSDYFDFDMTAERLKSVTAPKAYQGVVYQDDLTDPPMPTNCYDWQARFAIAVPIMPAETSDAPIDQLQNRVCACLHKTILSNDEGGFDPQLGGLAIRCDVKAPELFAVFPSGIHDGVTFFVEVMYRHSLQDPSVQ